MFLSLFFYLVYIVSQVTFPSFIYRPGQFRAIILLLFKTLWKGTTCWLENDQGDDSFVMLAHYLSPEILCVYIYAYIK